MAKLRLLADENFPGDAVRALREAGYDVAWVVQEAAGASDDQVLSMARKQERLLLTFDKDFGELVFLRGADASMGVVLFRITMKSSAFAAERVVAVLAGRDDWERMFAVVEDERLRIVSLPKLR